MLVLNGDRLQSISIGCLGDMGDAIPQLRPTAPKLNVFPRNVGTLKDFSPTV